jgi:DNA adenine methylase
VSIGLLEAGVVSKIALADKDPLVAAFWQTVFSKRAKDLANLVLNASVTLKEWRRQRESAPRSTLGLAFKCLFLSRTNFSGCLTEATGPIGGVRQGSEYDISCRFNKSRLANRILELSRLKDKVLFVRCQSWKMTMKHISSLGLHQSSPQTVLYYLDPPFFGKARKLYREYFDDAAHLDLADAVSNLKSNYVLSYDDDSRARELYSLNSGFARVNLQYNARIDDGQRLVASEILVSNLIADLRRKKLLGSLGCVIPLPHRRKKTVVRQEKRIAEQLAAGY